MSWWSPAEKDVPRERIMTCSNGNVQKSGSVGRLTLDGTSAAESQKYLYTAWWLPLISGLTINLLVMSSNLMGDWLHDRLDPTRRQL